MQFLCLERAEAWKWRWEKCPRVRVQGWRMEAGKNPWLLNSSEELRGLYGCCYRQRCCVNPAYSQFLNFYPYKNVRDRSRVTGCASEWRGPCQGEALLFPWSSTHAHLVWKKCRQMLGEHLLYPGAVRTPSQVDKGKPAVVDPAGFGVGTGVWGTWALWDPSSGSVSAQCWAWRVLGLAQDRAGVWHCSAGDNHPGYQINRIKKRYNQ